MAADILAYKATHVPVGEDQKQHLELTRDIAQKFNNDFGAEVFPLVEPIILGEAARVMSLRDGTKKMASPTRPMPRDINLTDDADAIAHKIRRARTDPNPVPDGTEAGGTRTERPEAFNLIEIYAALAERPIAEVMREHRRQAVLRLQGGADRTGGRETWSGRRRDAPAACRSRPCRRRAARRGGARPGTVRAGDTGGPGRRGAAQALAGRGRTKPNDGFSPQKWQKALRRFNEARK